MTHRDEDGTRIAVQSLGVGDKTSSVLLDLRIARNELLDVIEQFEAIAKLRTHCPRLSEVRAWRSSASESVAGIGERLLNVAAEYRGQGDEGQE